jgi:hypothetical protein
MLQQRGHDPAGSCRSDATIAVLSGAAFSRACASLIGPRRFLRWRALHARCATAAVATRTTPTSTSAAITVTSYVARNSPTLRISHHHTVRDFDDARGVRVLGDDRWLANTQVRHHRHGPLTAWLISEVPSRAAALRGLRYGETG